jgi:hypothetical protein
LTVRPDISVITDTTRIPWRDMKEAGGVLHAEHVVRGAVRGNVRRRDRVCGEGKVLFDFEIGHHDPGRCRARSERALFDERCDVTPGKSEQSGHVRGRVERLTILGAARRGADSEMLTLRRPLRGDQPLARVRMASLEHTLELGRINDTDKTERLCTGAEPPAGTLNRIGVILDRERRVGRPLRKQSGAKIHRRRIKVANNRSRDR